MPRTLADLAAEAAGQVADLPPMERSVAIRDALRQTRPNADPDEVRRVAAAAAGYTEPAAKARAAKSPAARRPGATAKAAPSRGGRQARRAGRRVVREVSGSTFGRVFRTGLYLTGLYWLLRSAGAVDRVATGARTGLAWLMDPALTWAARAPAEPDAEPAAAGIPLDPARTR